MGLISSLELVLDSVAILTDFQCISVRFWARFPAQIPAMIHTVTGARPKSFPIGTVEFGDTIHGRNLGRKPCPFSGGGAVGLCSNCWLNSGLETRPIFGSNFK